MHPVLSHCYFTLLYITLEFQILRKHSLIKIYVYRLQANQIEKNILNASNFRWLFFSHSMMTVVAYWRVETIVSKYSHCRILSKFWRPKNLGHERRRRLNKSQPSLWKQQQPPPRVFFLFKNPTWFETSRIWYVQIKNKKTILSFVMYIQTASHSVQHWTASEEILWLSQREDQGGKGGRHKNY